MYVGSGVTIGPGARVKEAIVLDRANIQVCKIIFYSVNLLLYDRFATFRTIVVFCIVLLVGSVIWGHGLGLRATLLILTPTILMHTYLKNHCSMTKAD